MIKFFRLIRKRLLANQKMGQYLVYALGEIILVVAGILIALQINNWNEGQKAKAKELDILKEVRKTMQLDYPLLERSIRGNEHSMRSCQIIMAALEQDQNYHDSLNFHFERAFLWWRHTLNTSGYDRAKTYGLEFIENDTIRDELNFIYTVGLFFESTINEREEAYYYNTASPILTDLFFSTEIAITPEVIAGNHKPLDFESLKQNQSYKTILRTSLGNREKMTEWLRIRLNLMHDIEIKLDKLIDSLE